jgi:polyadenylate-binding protein
VGPFVRRQERETGTASSKFQNVYVKNLGEDVTEEKLREVFEEFGKTTSAVIMKVRPGFGYRGGVVRG